MALIHYPAQKDAASNFSWLTNYVLLNAFRRYSSVEDNIYNQIDLVTRFKPIIISMYDVKVGILLCDKIIICQNGQSVLIPKM